MSNKATEVELENYFSYSENVGTQEGQLMVNNAETDHYDDVDDCVAPSSRTFIYPVTDGGDDKIKDCSLITEKQNVLMIGESAIMQHLDQEEKNQDKSNVSLRKWILLLVVVLIVNAISIIYLLFFKEYNIIYKCDCDQISTARSDDMGHKEYDIYTTEFLDVVDVYSSTGVHLYDFDEPTKDPTQQPTPQPSYGFISAVQ